MRDLNVPEIEDPERYFPEPKLVREPDFRDLPDGTVEILLPGGKRQRIHALYRDIAEGLAEGIPYRELEQRLPRYPKDGITTRRLVRKFARRCVWHLHQHGFLALPLDEPPRVFKGRYEREKELGRGGLGIVHLCRDTEEGGRLVVVKHPWGVKNSIRSGQKALGREIVALSELEHPGIPPLLDHFVRDDLLHLVRPFVDGRTLSHLHPRGIKDPSTRLDILTQIADILGAMHDQGALCLDIAPGNFMVEAGGRVLLTDLGTVSFMDDEGGLDLGAARGSPGYTSPEVRTAKKRRPGRATPRSEVFSFGRLAYWTATGRRPRRHWSADELLEGMAEHGVEEDEARVIARLSADAPEDRPASMAEAAALLRTLRVGT